MFSYKKVEIRQILKVAPEETYRNVLVFGEVFEKFEESEIDNHYFLIEDTIIYDEEGAHEYSGYMKAYFPSRIIDEMYLYLVKSTIEGYEMFFIDPLLYEESTDSELELLLLETIEHMNNNAEENLLENLYVNEMLFYELKGKSKQKYGHQFMTNELIELVANGKDDFYKKYEFNYHVEPIIYKLSENQLVFITTDDINSGTFRLLSLDKNGFLFQEKRLYLDDAVNFFETENYSVRDIMNIYNITKEIETLGKIL